MASTTDANNNDNTTSNKHPTIYKTHYTHNRHTSQEEQSQNPTKSKKTKRNTKSTESTPFSTMNNTVNTAVSTLKSALRKTADNDPTKITPNKPTQTTEPEDMEYEETNPGNTTTNPTKKVTIVTIAPSPSAKQTTTTANKQSDDENMDLEEDTELIPNNDNICLKEVSHIYMWKNFFPNELHDKAVPYKDWFGENGHDSAHHDIVFASLMMGKVKWNTKNLTAGQQTLCSKPGHSTTIWLTGVTRVINDELGEIRNILTKEEMDRFLTVILRMAHTPPEVLFKGLINRGTTPANTGARLWYGAKMAMGSWYLCDSKGNFRPNSRKQKQKQTTLPFKRAAASTDASSKQPTNTTRRTGTTNNQTTGNSAAPPTKAPPRSRHTAAQTAHTRPYAIRVNYKLNIKPQGKQTANDCALEIVASMLAAFQHVDPMVVIYPWKIADMPNHTAIKNPSEVPDKVSTMRTYADRFRPKSNGNLWCKMHLGCQEPIENLTSSNGSNTTDWFADNECAGYKCAVQGSDDTIPVGDFIYSGPFTDHVRLQNEIVKILNQQGRTPIHFGCRTKKQMEVKTIQDNKYRNWIMADNQMVHIECDRNQAKELKKFLYVHFNKIDNSLNRPGSYNIRFLPDITQIKTGPSGKKLRACTFKKHQAVVMSLTLIQTEDIKALDKPHKDNGQEYTLREYLLKLTYPLVPKENEKTTPLFHSVDSAAAGQNISETTVYLTAYNDRANMAEELVGILPLVVLQVGLGHDAMKAWFHETAIAGCHDVKLDYDAGEWTGDWTTEEDNLQQALLDDDMGINFHIDGLEDLEDIQVIATVDNQSVTSYGFDLLGADTSTTNTQNQALASRSAEETAAPESGGAAN